MLAPVSDQTKLEPREIKIMALANLGLEIDEESNALIITEPQNDFLSPNGVTGIADESVTVNNVVET